MFEPFTPRHFCREFVELQGSSSLAQLMAAILGLKPLIDVWIMKDRLDQYLELCRMYGLHARIDTMSVYFKDAELKGEIIGRDRINTTRAMGIPFEADVNGTVHIYLSKDRNLLRKGMWYPLIIKDRVISQPRADSLRFGHTLGYPECCISFFKSYNNWFRYNFLHEVYRNSKKTFHHFCNPLAKDMPYTYIYHMPCSFNCTATMKAVHILRNEIRKREPGYVKLIDMHLRLPYLVFFERNIYAFNGRLNGGTVTYTEVYPIDLMCAKVDYSSMFREGDRIVVENDKVHVYRGSSLLHIIEGGFHNKVREVPFLISFQ